MATDLDWIVPLKNWQEILRPFDRALIRSFFQDALVEADYYRLNSRIDYDMMAVIDDTYQVIRRYKNEKRDRVVAACMKHNVEDLLVNPPSIPASSTESRVTKPTPKTLSASGDVNGELIDALILCATSAELYETRQVFTKIGGVMGESSRLKDQTSIHFGSLDGLKFGFFSVPGDDPHAMLRQTESLSSCLSIRMFIMIGVVGGFHDTCKTGDIIVPINALSFEGGSMARDGGNKRETAVITIRDHLRQSLNQAVAENDILHDIEILEKYIPLDQYIKHVLTALDMQGDDRRRKMNELSLEKAKRDALFAEMVRLTYIDTSNKVTERGYEHLKELKDQEDLFGDEVPAPVVHLQSIVSSNYIRNDATAENIQEWRTNLAKASLFGVDQHTYPFYYSLKDKTKDFLAVKGVSDYADNRMGNFYFKVAAQRAASFAFKFAQQNLKH